MKCPFCNNEMEDLGRSSWPVTPPNSEDYGTERHGRHCGGVWRNIHEYVCHRCGFWARFWEEMHEEYAHNRA